MMFFRHVHLLIAASAAVLAFAGTPSPAGAQAPERGVAVRERPRPELDAAGLPAGAFRLYPSFEVGVLTDDNIYRSAEDETDDHVVSFRPRLTAVSQWSNHELVFDAGVEWDKFHVHRDESTEDWFLSLGGRLDITRRSHAPGEAGPGGAPREPGRSGILGDPEARLPRPHGRGRGPLPPLQPPLGLARGKARRPLLPHPVAARSGTAWRRSSA